MFFDTISVEISNSKNFYKNHYKAVFLEIEVTTAHFELILNIPSLVTALFGSFRTPIVSYNCMRLPKNTNYLFLYLEKQHFLIKQSLLHRTNLNLNNVVEKTRFIEKLARKSF